MSGDAAPTSLSACQMAHADCPIIMKISVVEAFA
jgi:hypothetical protein